MRLFYTILFCSFGAVSLFTQSEAWRQKIDARLLERVQEEGKAEFLIILQAQADAQPANQIRSKAEKGQYILQTLSALAEQTQGPIKNGLDQAGAPWRSFWVINAMWSVGSIAVIEQIARMPEVARIEDNPTLSLQLLPEEAVTTEVSVPDRTLIPNSWGLIKINADDVWALGYTGSGVVVGGQDTGYEWAHPAIKDKYRGWDGTTANHNYNWHDAIHALIGGGANSCGLNLNAPCDDNNHGTHTMGTMAGGENDLNVIGVAPNAQWIGCRNMEEGDGTPDTYIECFQWFIAPTNLSNGSPDPSKAPDVINNSWGCPVSEGCNSSNFGTMETVINNVRAAGIVVVVSAGNDGSACSTVNSPAAIYSGSFSVGATSNVSNDLIANFSSRGPVTVFGPVIQKPDISAPGVGINSCVGNSNNSGSYSYASFSGTSMAGPHVVGLVALILSARPDLKGQVSAIENIIKNTAIARFASAPFCGGDNVSSLPNNVYGYGRIDALAAINSALALPVELTVFKARIEGKTTALDWATASESDCERFDIQRSADGSVWQTLDALPCLGRSGGVYQYKDEAPLNGVNYYRLKQVDVSGTFAYSAVAAVAFSASGVSIAAQVSIADQSVRFQVVGAISGQDLQLEIFNAEGQFYYRAPFQHQILDVSEWAGGMYVVLLKEESGRVLARGKMVKM